MISREQMIALNRRQGDFYDKVQAGEDAAAQKGVGSGYSENETINWISRIWATMRDAHSQASERAGVSARIRGVQAAWVAEKQGQSFFEIGCFSGSSKTFDLIRAAGHYTGIDLSEAATGALRSKVEEQELSYKADIVCGDFLEYTSPTGRTFDFIYAHGVLHHFENPAPVFQKIADLLSDDGVLVFVEPVAINHVFRMIRSVYRPFQSDSSWEWPFRAATVNELKKHFKIVDGFGWGKRSTLVSALTGLPLIGPAVFPLYRNMILREIAARHDSRAFWQNSMVLGKCQRI